jgi:hypothetical protein
VGGGGTEHRLADHTPTNPEVNQFLIKNTGQPVFKIDNKVYGK